MLLNSKLNPPSFITTGFAAGVALSGATTKAPKIDKSRISAISDEVSKSPAEAIAFAKEFGMQWLSLRDVPGGKQSYHTMEPDQLAAVHAELKEAGIKVSFLDTPLLKFGL